MQRHEWVLRNYTQQRLPLTSGEIDLLIAQVAKATKERRSCAVGLVVAGEQRMRTLNRTHRRKDAVTDVLSFPLDDEGGTGVRELGDIILAPAYIDRQVRRYGGTRKQRYAILLIHGLLHLFGYDHEDDREFAQMLALEEAVYAQVALKLRLPSQRIV